MLSLLCSGSIHLAFIFHIVPVLFGLGGCQNLHIFRYTMLLEEGGGTTNTNLKAVLFDTYCPAIDGFVQFHLLVTNEDILHKTLETAFCNKARFDFEVLVILLYGEVLVVLFNE